MITTITISLLALFAISSAGAAVKTFQHAKLKLENAKLKLKFTEMAIAHDEMLDRLAEKEAERIALFEANKYLKEITGKTYMQAAQNMDSVRRERENTAHSMQASRLERENKSKPTGKSYPRKPNVSAPMTQKSPIEVIKRKS